jgi:2-polyprenyl-6-methoxyphenol hydroxylase-like FAD-dependent oxidoreductase
VNGAEQARIELKLPAEVPYCFACLPQYAQDADGVTSRLRTASGDEQEVRSRFLVGCDGAHSVVRKTLGLSFGGGALPEERGSRPVRCAGSTAFLVRPDGHLGARVFPAGPGALSAALGRVFAS